MSRLSFGDVVLLKFPFTDNSASKRRPPLVISDFEDGDIIVCRITSRLYQIAFDIVLTNWEKAGLKLPSIVRIHKIATLTKNMVELKMGEIHRTDKDKARELVGKLSESNAH
ncbi:type II toxin-antitoxin system PemK/MazF family toxin [Imperialibacter roseus]|uniref:Type II toxin-antitoxin system PemK/MazF family toxin n=1 Tax=Imperialibacter roseus TaxID=1324217 RepID=A0ABZ0IMA1_9BACT|nr:type II toxin-antitoxin system PemK/MazF family toxin [Imperialibacter roseus]WOK05666.1 type II toxin-antitoxin system PemK/MazF family toxin [Imperialibacter roseus]|tara:strand:- start:2494 stop:2829 length:336 start_codon:yes stop_codon:yes gene_type:complete